MTIDKWGKSSRDPETMKLSSNATCDTEEGTKERSVNANFGPKTDLTAIMSKGNRNDTFHSAKSQDSD